MTGYRYADWLKTHAKKKSIMEKLERSLVPFQLFAAIDFARLHAGAATRVKSNGNTYKCELLSRHEASGKDVFLVKLAKEKMGNAWEDLLMGYSEFKVVMHNGKVVTIYPNQERYFENIIGMFEAEQYYDLYKVRTLYIKNLLARYILLKLINTHLPHMSSLYSLRHNGELIAVLAGVENREWIMYAFDRKEANEVARHYQGKCTKLTVVYFINRNFEHENRNRNFHTPGVQVMSIKQYYRTLCITATFSLARKWGKRLPTERL